MQENNVMMEIITTEMVAAIFVLLKPVLPALVANALGVGMERLTT